MKNIKLFEEFINEGWFSKKIEGPLKFDEIISLEKCKGNQAEYYFKNYVNLAEKDSKGNKEILRHIQDKVGQDLGKDVLKDMISYAGTILKFDKGYGTDFETDTSIIDKIAEKYKFVNGND